MGMMKYIICEYHKIDNKTEVCSGQAKFRNKEGYNSPIFDGSCAGLFR